MYNAIADFYNSMMPEKYYDRFAKFCRKMIRKYSKAKGNDSNIVLDCGCGTGILTVKMAGYGYDMIGLDISEDMLNVARENASGANLPKEILWTCQDMTKMDLYGTASCIICSTDTLCHLTSEKQVKKYFALVKNYLTPGGVFIFDVLPEEYFREEIHGNVFYADSHEGTCIWQGFYNENTKKVIYELTFFTGNGDGTYSREDETIEERAYSPEEIREYLDCCGLEIAEINQDVFDGKNKNSCSRTVYTVRHKARLS